jgi:hypothetical protein
MTYSDGRKTTIEKQPSVQCEIACNCKDAAGQMGVAHYF